MLTAAGYKKSGPEPGIYEWRGKRYVGMAALAEASGRTISTVCDHLRRHGNLDRLGIGPQCNFPKDGRGSRASARCARVLDREWPSLSALAREADRPISTVKLWLDRGDEERLLAALMAAGAKREADARAAREREQAARDKALGIRYRRDDYKLSRHSGASA